MSMARTCGYAYDMAGGVPDGDVNANVQMWIVKDPTAATSALAIGPNGGAVDYEALVNFANGADTVKFRFGRRDRTAENAKYAGHVAPVCGELVLRLTDTQYHTPDTGPQLLQKTYYALLKEFWHNVPDYIAKDFALQSTVLSRNSSIPNLIDAASPSISAYKQNYLDSISYALNTSGAVTLYGSLSIPPGGAVKLIEDTGSWSVGSDLTDKGWAGAAIWYNRVAEMNGALSTAFLNIPMPVLYPFLSEKVYEQKRKGDGVVDFADRFDPTDYKLDGYDKEIATVMWLSYDYWQSGGAMESPHARPSGNAVQDILNALLGTNGLFSMRDNENVHPLAQLSGVGKALIEASLRNLTNVAVGGASGAFLAKISDFAGITASTFNSFLLKFTMITIVAGFILFYIVPFLPFIYFMFAFGGWVKGIFEAMVGAPLWALAHIRIDGQGLAGQAAVSGYFLIFEIFLRPILMIFGLIASISTFAALISVLNLVFDQVVSNVGGADAQDIVSSGDPSIIANMRGVVDEFFFTVMYVIVVYLMGMSSFKLIDLIPNQILRWMGQSITTFNDSQENAAESLAGKATQGAQQTSNAIGGGLGKLAGLGGK
jgi:hypothetical protein